MDMEKRKIKMRKTITRTPKAMKPTFGVQRLLANPLLNGKDTAK